MDNLLQPIWLKAISDPKGCPKTVLCLCCTRGKAVHERGFYPQVTYAQSFDPTCATSLGPLIHRPYAHTICRFVHSKKPVVSLYAGHLHVDKWARGRYNGACFCLTGFQLRGYPCQWNFGSSA